MKALKRNKRLFYYCLYEGKQPVLDEYNRETGEYELLYGAATAFRANISPATGQTNAEQFGNTQDYDKVIVIDNPSCPIDENSVLFVDTEPEYDDDGFPLFDYIVKKAARSLNSVSYAIKKVRT